MIETLPNTTIPAAELGEGRADPARCAAAAVRALGGAAGAGFALASLTLEMGPGNASGAVEVRLRVDKRTRAVVFATAEAWAGDAMIFTARGLFAVRE